jgi:predicted nucleic acid-binding protein
MRKPPRSAPSATSQPTDSRRCAGLRTAGRLRTRAAGSKVEAEKGRVTISGLTFDTGVLIALERRQQRAWNVYREARNAKVPITVPTPVVAEWWRGRTDAREHVRSGLLVEWLSEPIAQLAGEARAKMPRSCVVDAIVMASAASREDVVYTGDLEDFDRLRKFFPSVRVLAI